MLMIPLKKAFSQLSPGGKTCSIENAIESFHHLISLLTRFPFFRFSLILMQVLPSIHSDILDFSVTVTTATSNPVITTH